MKQLHLYISGFVQGVGLRAFTVKKARKLGLTGWVRNLTDGRVEAVFQGDAEKLNRLIEALKKGSYFAEIKNIMIKEEKIVEEFLDMIKRETV